MKKQLKRKCIVYGLGIIVYAGAVWGQPDLCCPIKKIRNISGNLFTDRIWSILKLSEEIMEKRSR